MQKIIIILQVIICLICIFMWTIGIRILSPEFTDTQLYLKYWYIAVIYLGVAWIPTLYYINKD